MTQYRAVFDAEEPHKGTRGGPSDPQGDVVGG